MTLADVSDPAAAGSPRRLSEVLGDLDKSRGDRVSLGDLVAGLKDRSFAPLMVLFAVPNVFLYLPGSSVITGLPLMILALQLIAGRPVVWLPRALGDRSIDRGLFEKIVLHATPWIERIERMARPRIWPNAPIAIDRTIGLACLVLSLLLFLPIPFANGLPAVAIIALGLALSERDGLWLLIGLVGAFLSVFYVVAIIGGGAFAVAKILS